MFSKLWELKPAPRQPTSLTCYDARVEAYKQAHNAIRIQIFFVFNNAAGQSVPCVIYSFSSPIISFIFSEKLCCILNQI